ncbi:MAG: GatB/YqeY domain-containing protein, partial [Deltaproteobacteria bacterium]|nr:GatB/YqeY domain-containing protein [Deltaproteobacteria bacterium]
MTLKDKIDQDLTAALRAKDTVRLNTLRQIKTYIKNREVELRSQLDDTGVVQILSTLVKQRRESIEQFGKGGRTDLVEKEERELKLLQGYLPAALSEAELIQLVDTVIAEEGGGDTKAMGRVMKAVMAKVAGRADGKIV